MLIISRLRHIPKANRARTWVSTFSAKRSSSSQSEIDANGSADDKPIRVGDVIVDIGQRKVEKVADIEAAIKEARDAGRKSVLLLVRTGDDSRFVAIRLKD